MEPLFCGMPASSPVSPINATRISMADPPQTERVAARQMSGLPMRVHDLSASGGAGYTRSAQGKAGRVQSSHARFVPICSLRYLTGGSCSALSMVLIFEPARGPKPLLPTRFGIVTAISPTLFS